ncbi:MAG: nitrous oxide reductase accessory protein NosL [Sulfurimonas sp.]|nr:nitrous oxide reductase accessory protein NosL [Sulfurimonas sp.]
MSKIKKSYKIDFNKETVGLMRNIKLYKNPSWPAMITLKNGKKLYFCSPKSMIEFYNQPGLRPEVDVKSENDMAQVFVTDFNNLKTINAKGAFFVYGANIISPAGDDMIPFESYEHAQLFSKKHNGKRVMSFKEIPPALIDLINGKI